MTDEQIVEAAKSAGKKTEFGELVRSPLVRGTFSAYEIGFIEGAEWAREQMMKDGNVILAEEDFDAEKEKSMEWGYNLCKEQMPMPEDTLIFRKGVEEGRRLEREDIENEWLEDRGGCFWDGVNEGKKAMEGKEEAIIKVLTQRADIARKVLLNHLKDDGQDGVKFAGYLEGKVDGYEQAIELLKEDIECISIELEEEDHHGQGQGDSGN